MLPEPTKDIDISSNRGYNEWDEGMDMGGESTEAEENIREVECKEQRKRKRNITIKVSTNREKEAMGTGKCKRKSLDDNKDR